MTHFDVAYSPDQARQDTLAESEGLDRWLERSEALCDAVSEDIAELASTLGGYTDVRRGFTVQRWIRAACAVGLTAYVAGAAAVAQWAEVPVVSMGLFMVGAILALAFVSCARIELNSGDAAARQLRTELFDTYAVTLRFIAPSHAGGSLAGDWLMEPTGFVKLGQVHPALHRTQALLDGWLAEDRGEHASAPAIG